MTEEHVFLKIKQTISSLDIDQISDNRKQLLGALANYIKQKIATNELIALNFICTHNSRRSHLSQVWAQTLAHYVGIKNIKLLFRWYGSHSNVPHGH